MSSDSAKEVERSSSPENVVDDIELSGLNKFGGTVADEHDMAMLGREQVLNVRVYFCRS
jgi:hypothetical protein